MGLLDSRRIQDAFISKIVKGYSTQELIGELILPEVITEKEKGVYLKFEKEGFLVYDTKRAPKSASLRAENTYSTGDVRLDEYCLEAGVDVREVEEVGTLFNLVNQQAKIITHNVNLEKEDKIATLLQNDSNYDATNKKILDGTAGKKYWSDLVDGDPIADILGGIEEVEGDSGMKPNTITFGLKSWYNFISHPKVQAKIRSDKNTIVTIEDAKILLDVEYIFIGRAVKSLDNTTFSKVWSDNVIISKKGMPSENIENIIPATGYTVRKKGYPKITTYESMEFNSTIVKYSDIYTPLILSYDNAYLIKNTQE